MKAVVFQGESKLEIREYPDPVPGPDEVVIRMKASGMCGSDLNHLHGPVRTGAELVIEGHEPCGVVELVGDAVGPSEARIGDRVMVHHYDGCRTCQFCRSGWTQYCPNARIVYGGLNGDGGHADFMKVPAHTLIKLPDSLSFKTGAAISCGTGTAYGAIKRIDLSADQTVAIFGQGPVGLSATMLAKAFGAKVIAVDVEPSRLEMAKQFGADYVVDAQEQDPVAAVRELTRGEGADKSIECSAIDAVRRQAVQSVRRWGTACMVGVFGRIEFDSEELIALHKTVLGSLTFSKNQQEECARFVAERRLDVESLFTNEFRLDEAENAYELFDQRKIGKGVFVFD
ncbi:zinc-binding dehydrogenase [Arthrobacter sp. Alg241-R88]|uniref:zinc-dependent alcohol dehydrogenase family protein n=1 Tax=Arthrobacter sp. Alg241-R88 TaxID=2305984 RepID=UPI0013D43DE5|nr:zinc-binding dehydrogenase [Arthrobacter sp. Alg241-R88]